MITFVGFAICGYIPGMIAAMPAEETTILPLTTVDPVPISETTENLSSTTLSSAENMIMSSTNNYIERKGTSHGPARSKIVDNIFNVSYINPIYMYIGKHD